MGSYGAENIDFHQNGESISSSDRLESIAIIGFSFGFPQDATSSEKFWEILMRKRSTASTFPNSRMNIDSMYHPDPNRRGQIAVARSHFLREDITSFDAEFFATSTTDAASMDPQQRLLLEYTYKALENAGQPMELVSGSKTSVYTGSFATDYLQIAYKDAEQCDTTTALGVSASFNANRISWFFNLTGNSANVDTACSSSLVALDWGCQGLWNGNESMSIVAGSNLILSPDNMHSLTNLNMLSPDGQCYSFDHRANGYSRGEGIGVLILKRVTDAIRDHDTIRGIIRSTGCNQDGHTPSITLPSSTAQETLIRETYKKAGLSMQPTRFFEAHGTGTPVGDPIESKALGSAFRQNRTTRDPLWVGAAKSNIGHLEGASGIAGVIKAMLVLEKGIIPPNTNFEKANPKIDTDFLRIRFPLEPIPWPTTGLRRASVNSFGNSGTNAHVVLDDVFHFLNERSLDGNHITVRDPPTTASLAGTEVQYPVSKSKAASQVLGYQNLTHKLLIFSSQDQAGLKRQASEYAAHFSNLQIRPDQWQTYVNDLAFTLSFKRSSLPWKSFSVVQSFQDLPDLERTLSSAFKSITDPHLGFIFSGQGAQWVGMGRELMKFPAFERSIFKSEEHLLDLGCSWRLCKEISRDKDSSINRPDFSQPICTALQIALVDLMEQFGIHPITVIGHSSGEIAAAYSAGAISAGSAMKLAYYRGLLASSLASSSDMKGTMISVGISKNKIVSYLDRVANQCGYHGLTIACINSPKNVTISGAEDQILTLKKILDSEKIFNRKLFVDVAYHSPHMKAIAEKYCTMIEDIEGGDPSPKPVTMISSVTGEIVLGDTLLSPTYWVSNLVSPVRFVDAVRNLLSRSAQKIRKKLDLSHRSYFHVSMLVEIGPHSVLQGPIMDICDDAPGATRMNYTSVLIRNNSAMSSMLNAVGQIKCLGYHVHMEQINNSNSKDCEQRMILHDLPGYMFDHSKQYWSESRISARYRLHHQGKLDLLGKPTPDWNPMEARWRNILRVSEMPWMEDHVINGSLIYPGAGMVVMAIEAANQMADENVVGFELKDVSFMKSLNIPQGSGGIETQLSLRLTHDSGKSLSVWSEFRLFTYEQKMWRECCHGFVRVKYELGLNEVSQGREDDQEVEEYRNIYNSMDQSCRTPMDPRIFYERLNRSGLGLGPSFHCISEGAYGDQNQAKGIIRLYEWIKRDHPQPHVIHPTSLDAIFHFAIAGYSGGGTKDMATMIPTYLRNIFICKDGLHFPADKYIKESAWTTSEDSLGAQFNGFALNTLKNKILLQFEDLKVTKIGESLQESGSLVTLATQQKCHNICFQPDPDFLRPPEALTYCQKVRDPEQTPFDRYMDMLGHKNPNLKILEIGSGEQDLAFDILRTLSLCHGQEIVSTRYDSYCFTANRQSILDEAREALQAHHRVTFVQMNVEKDPIGEGLEAESFDIIIGSITLQESKVFLQNMRKIIKPGGKLLLRKLDQFCVTNSGHSTSTEASNLLSENGFTDQEFQISTSRTTGRLSTGSLYVHGLISSPSSESNDKQICVISDPSSTSQTQSAKRFIDLLHSRGINNVIATSLAAASNIEQPDGTVFVTLIEVYQPFIFSISRENYSLLKEFLIFAPNILWVNSHGGLFAKPEYALMQGLARSFRNEYEDHLLTIVSFELHGSLSDLQLNKLIEVLKRNHLVPTGQRTKLSDMEYIEMEGALHIPRMISDRSLSNQLQVKGNPQQSGFTLFQGEIPLRMTMGSPGLLDTLHFREDTEIFSPLVDDEIEVQVQAIGMNFKDCLIALGQLSNAKLGQECAGVVTRAGSNTHFAPGDRVILAAFEGYRTLARGKANTAYKIPDNMPLTTATAIPAQFGTAWAVIHGVAKLQSKETILIHAAAGGTGQAIIQVTKLIGATIFATVGSQDKKQILIDEYHIPEEHIFYSRDTRFAKGIKQLTGGRGVDVVVNSLIGEGLIASWECIAPCGRFVEIGKKDIMSNSNLPMSYFQKNVSFTGFDGALWGAHHHDIDALINMFTDNTLHLPRPFLIFNISEAEQVFRLVQGGKFAGKIVLEVTKDSQVPTILDTRLSVQLDSEATYVIAGGFGGIGRATARWMVSRSARNLVLLSRYGPRTPAAYELLDELQSQGIRVESPACDITNTALIHEVFKVLSQTMPPIKGCLQASILAKDLLFKDMDYDSWKPAVDCKALGSWNLHSVLPRGMDFFILLASASGVGGLRGQTNYNAGNTYEDALARYRVSQGEKAISLDLGAMTDDGILAEHPDLLDRVLGYGTLEPISRQQYFNILDYYCDPSLPPLSITESQAVIGLGVGGGSGLESFDFGRHPMILPLVLEHERRNAPTNDGNQANYREMIAGSTSLDEAADIVNQAVVDKLARSLSAMQDKASIDSRKPLQMYGVDSLLAIELRNWIVKEFVAEIAVFETQGVSTLETLSRLVAGRTTIKHENWMLWSKEEEE